MLTRSPNAGAKQTGMSITANLTVVLPIVLAIMGGAIAVWPPNSTRWRVASIASFAVIGAATIIAGYKDRRQTTKDLLGGDQFPFVSALYGPGMDPKGVFPLVVTNPSDLPLHDVTILIFPRNGSPANRHTVSIPTLHPHQFMRGIDLSVPLDDYVMDIRTRAAPNGFFERLILKLDEKGDVHQSYYVRRVGSNEKLMDAQ
jgi:hypothetical protein